jgi:hypothetical protein
MAWNDLASNQMVSFTDAQGGGFTLNSGQSAVTSNQMMDKTVALGKYILNATNMSAYASNQLVPKSAWVSGGNPPSTALDGAINIATAANSISLQYPLTVAVGDCLVLIITVQTNTSSPTPTIPSGWTLFGSDVTSLGGSSYLFSKIATSSAESGTTLVVNFTFSGTNALVMGGQILRYTGTKTTSGYITALVVGSQSGGSLQSPFSGSSTSNFALAVAISLTGFQNTASATHSYSLPTGWVSGSNSLATSGTRGIRIIESTKVVLTSGTSMGTVTATVTPSGYIANFNFYLYSI